MFFFERFASSCDIFFYLLTNRLDLATSVPIAAGRGLVSVQDFVNESVLKPKIHCDRLFLEAAIIFSSRVIVEALA